MDKLVIYAFDLFTLNLFYFEGVKPLLRIRKHLTAFPWDAHVEAICMITPRFWKPLGPLVVVDSRVLKEGTAEVLFSPNIEREQLTDSNPMNKFTPH